MNTLSPTVAPTSSNTAFNNDIQIIQLSVNILISLINMFLIIYQSVKSRHCACLFCFGCCYVEDDDVMKDNPSTDSTNSKRSSAPITIPTVPE
jgi:hypothetical protein